MTQGEDGSFFLELQLVVVKIMSLLKGAEFCVHCTAEN